MMMMMPADKEERRRRLDKTHDETNDPTFYERVMNMAKTKDKKK